jgi:hypothetical protein
MAWAGTHFLGTNVSSTGPQRHEEAPAVLRGFLFFFKVTLCRLTRGQLSGVHLSISCGLEEARIRRL